MFTFFEYLEILLGSLVSDTGFSLCLSHYVVKILLKVVRVLDQMHGHVIVCGTASQTRQDGPGMRAVRGGVSRKTHSAKAEWKQLKNRNALNKI